MDIQYSVVVVAVSMIVSVLLVNNDRYNLVRMYKAGATIQDKAWDTPSLARALVTSLSISFRLSSGGVLVNSCTIFNRLWEVALSSMFNGGLI